MEGRDLAREVTPGGAGRARRRRGRAARRRARHRASSRSIVRNLRERGCRLTLMPCTQLAPTRCSSASPTPSSSRTAPATRPRSTTSSAPCASWSGRCRCSASASATSCCAGRSASRPSSCRFGHRGANHPVKDLDDRQDRDHRAEPRLRGGRPGRRAHARRRRAGALGDRLRRGRALAREPLRPHGRGPDAARRARPPASSTTPRRAPARTTRSTCSTASWRWLTPRCLGATTSRRS